MAPASDDADPPSTGPSFAPGNTSLKEASTRRRSSNDAAEQAKKCQGAWGGHHARKFISQNSVADSELSVSERNSRPASPEGGAACAEGKKFEHPGKIKKALKSQRSLHQLNPDENAQQGSNANEENDNYSLGADWIARMEDTGELRDAKTTCIQQVNWCIDHNLPVLHSMDGLVKREMNRQLEPVLTQLQHNITRHVLDLVRTDLLELRNLRKEHSQVEDKLSLMNRSYLKEITQMRDVKRVEQEIVEEAAGSVEFYEPLHFLSPEVRSTVLAIMDEKIKAIFAFDPSLKDRTDNIELARFEDSLQKDRIASFEKLNAALREEVRDLRNKLKKAEACDDKRSWEFQQARVQMGMELSKVQKELSDAIQKEKKTLAELAEVREKLEKALASHSKVSFGKISFGDSKEGDQEEKDTRKSSKGKSPKAGGGSAAGHHSAGKAAPHQGASEPPAVPPAASPAAPTEPPKQVSHVGVQATPSHKTGAAEGNSKPTLRKAATSAFAAKTIQAEAIDFGSWEPQPEDGGQVQSRNTAIKKRDRRIAELTLQVEALQTQVDAQAEAQQCADAEDQPRNSTEGLDGAGAQGTEYGKVNRTGERASEGYRRGVAETAAERAERVKHLEFTISQLESSNELAHEQIAELQSLLARAREEARQSEARVASMQKCAEQAAPVGGLTQGGLADLEAEMSLRKDLSEELEQTKEALSILISRNAALEIEFSADLAQSAESAESPEAEPQKSMITALGEADSDTHQAYKKRAALLQENQKIMSLVSQQAELREKVVVQRAQLQEVVRENQVVQLALNETQQEVKNLLEQLRKYVPNTESISEDMESMMARLDRCARNGAGAHFRLHKEAKLREIKGTAKAHLKDSDALELMSCWDSQPTTAMSTRDDLRDVLSSPGLLSSVSVEQTTPPKALLPPVPQTPVLQASTSQTSTHPPLKSPTPKPAAPRPPPKPASVNVESMAMDHLPSVLRSEPGSSCSSRRQSYSLTPRVTTAPVPCLQGSAPMPKAPSPHPQQAGQPGSMRPTPAALQEKRGSLAIGSKGGMLVLGRYGC